MTTLSRKSKPSSQALMSSMIYRNANPPHRKGPESLQRGQKFALEGWPPQYNACAWIKNVIENMQWNQTSKEVGISGITQEVTTLFPGWYLTGAYRQRHPGSAARVWSSPQLSHPYLIFLCRRCSRRSCCSCRRCSRRSCCSCRCKEAPGSTRRFCSQASRSWRRMRMARPPKLTAGRLPSSMYRRIVLVLTGATPPPARPSSTQARVAPPAWFSSAMRSSASKNFSLIHRD